MAYESTADHLGRIAKLASMAWSDIELALRGEVINAEILRGALDGVNRIERLLEREFRPNHSGGLIEVER